MYTASNKGHIPKGVRISYSLEADEDPDADPPLFDDDDDPENNGHNTQDDGLLKIRSTETRRYQRQHHSHLQLQQQTRNSAKSIEEARLFAAAMLNESERRRNQHNLHNEHNLSFQQESSSTLRRMLHKATSNRNINNNNNNNNNHNRRPTYYHEINLIEEPVIKSYDPKQFWRKMVCRFLLLAALIVGVSTFIVYAVDDSFGRNETSSSSGNSGVTGTADNGERIDSTIGFLFDHEISSAHALYEESSPQYKAVEWIATKDPEQLPIPAYGAGGGGGGDDNSFGSTTVNPNNSDNHFHFVQRYVLAVLYFALDGEGWNNDLHFTSNLHECSWFEREVDRDGEAYAMGVTCDSNLQVRNLILRKCDLLLLLWRVLPTVFFFIDPLTHPPPYLSFLPKI
jgi:hypothetical protein